MILSEPMTRGRRDAPAALFLYAVFAGLMILKFILHELLQNRGFFSFLKNVFAVLQFHLCKTNPTNCINMTTREGQIIPNDIKIQNILKFFDLVLAKREIVCYNIRAV